MSTTDEHAEQRSSAPLPADGTLVRAGGTMVGVPAGTRAIVRHHSPAGLSNVKSGLVWLELDSPIVWSHGVFEHPGYWASPAEFTIDQADERWPGLPGPDRHNPLAVLVVLTAFAIVSIGFSVLVVEAIARGVFW